MGDLPDWEEMVVGIGCSEEEISRMRRCNSLKNIPDRGSSGLGTGVRGHGEKVHTGLASSLVTFVAENDS